MVRFRTFSLRCQDFIQKALYGAEKFYSRSNLYGAVLFKQNNEECIRFLEAVFDFQKLWLGAVCFKNYSRPITVRYV